MRVGLIIGNEIRAIMDIDRDSITDRDSRRYDKIVLIGAKGMDVGITSIGKRDRAFLDKRLLPFWNSHLPHLLSFPSWQIGFQEPCQALNINDKKSYILDIKLKDENIIFSNGLSLIKESQSSYFLLGDSIIIVMKTL